MKQNVFADRFANLDHVCETICLVTPGFSVHRVRFQSSFGRSLYCTPFDDADVFSRRPPIRQDASRPILFEGEADRSGRVTKDGRMVRMVPKDKVELL